MTFVDAWGWWLVAAVLLVVVEVATLDLVFVMFAGGALAAGLVDLALGGQSPVVAQVAAFAVVSVGLLGVVRPVAQRHLTSRPATRTGVAALVGSQAVVVEQVDGHSGRVKLAGEIWSARAYDGQAVLEAGRSVDVIQIDGATALVL
jgi:membrane protein implicated in regulation of membrane protease activity